MNRRKPTLKTCLVLGTVLLATLAEAEIITATDGRKIELKADGTYQVMQSEPGVPINMTELAPFFEHHIGEYDRHSVRFMPIFKNETGKTVIGFKFRTVFSNAFKEEVFSFSGESSERVLPNATSTSEVFFYFKDNQFIGDEPYDKLSIFLSAGTGSIRSTITAIVFKDGEIISAE